jgi:hypothetical protein
VSPTDPVTRYLALEPMFIRIPTEAPGWEPLCDELTRLWRAMTPEQRAEINARPLPANVAAVYSRREEVDRLNARVGLLEDSIRRTLRVLRSPHIPAEAGMVGLIDSIVGHTGITADAAKEPR